jgi:hypothetical protein
MAQNELNSNVCFLLQRKYLISWVIRNPLAATQPRPPAELFFEILQHVDQTSRARRTTAVYWHDEAQRQSSSDSWRLLTLPRLMCSAWRSINAVAATAYVPGSVNM